MSVSTTFSHYFLSPHSQNRRLLLPSSLSPPSSTPLSFSISTSQKAAVFAASFTNCSSPVENEEEDGPTSIDLVPITGEEQFDRVIADAQQLDVPLILLWMANWCRKCIYLKPKLEKLAAEYYPGIRFYCVDVNNVPQRLVTRAGITKMPTIQLWRDSQKQAEVIGGQNKAWLVVDDVRRMIESEE